MRRSRLPSAAILIGAAVVLLSLLFAGKVSRKMPDFEVYWTAAVRARAAEPLYRSEDGHYQNKYLPAFAVLAIPAGLVPLPIAKAVWFAIEILLLVALVALSLALLPEARKPAWLLVTVALVAMLKFFGHEVVLGQVNTLLGSSSSSRCWRSGAGARPPPACSSRSRSSSSRTRSFFCRGWLRGA